MATASPSEPEEPRVSRPLPCPGCDSTKGSARVGTFRSQCLNCNSTYPNAEFGLDNQESQ